MARAIASARLTSSGSPFSIVCCRRLLVSFERRSRCSLTEKTLAPKIWFPGSVRSSVPSEPPLDVHWAAYRLCGRVLGIAANLSDPVNTAFIHVDKDRGRLSTPGRMGEPVFSTGVQRRTLGG